MAFKKVKGSIDRIFDKNLQDLVRGIRNHKDDEANFISMCIDEIKVELKQENLTAKANAARKLIYLQMLGYEISWAAFNIIEVMSSAKFTHKRIGYLVASQSFHSDTDVLMLATNLIKKDLTSNNVFDVGVALTGLSCFITPDLARDLTNDLLSLMSSNKAYTRKRAVLISYKIFLNYPEALRIAFPRLREKLEDPDPGVQSAAVNVICELARKHPKNYLSLAPVFFKLMTSSPTTNNWVLIKVIKLFGALTPLEPRLGKKLIEPLTNLIHNTSAMSLLYECINTVIQGMQDHSSSIQGFPTIMKLCVQKLRILIEDSDQNLKYLGLLALSRILKSHPKSVQAHKDLILQCLDDKDESIRLRALDLLFGMVSKKNLMEIVQKLLAHVQKSETIQYRDELISKIIEICSRNNFHFITNFEWYLTVLAELTRIDGTSRHGSMVSSQILDVAIRVKTIRPFAAVKMASILQNSNWLSPLLRRNGMIEVLYAAAYICGEFCQFIDDLKEVLMSMLGSHVLQHPTHIQHIFLQNITKMYTCLLVKTEESEDFESALTLTRSIQEKLAAFLQSSNLEVQERASCTSALLKQVEKMLMKSTSASSLLVPLFKGELNPVAPKAQKKVPIPEGLDLDAWINSPPSSSSESDEEEDHGTSKEKTFYSSEQNRKPELSPEELQKRKEMRRKQLESNPNYLFAKKTDPPVSADSYQQPDNEVQGAASPTPTTKSSLSTSDQYMKLEQQRQRKVSKKSSKQKKSKKEGKKVKVEQVEDVEEMQPIHKVEIVDYEMPEGAIVADSDEEADKNDIYKALDISFDMNEEVVVKKNRKIKTEEIVDSKKTKKKSKKNKKVKEEPSKKKMNGKVDPISVKDTTEEVKEQEAVNDMKKDEKISQKDSVKKEKTSKSKKSSKKEKKKKKIKTEKVESTKPQVEEVKRNFKLLAEDQIIRVEYETRAESNNHNQISLFCSFTNLSDEHVTSISFNLTDTLNTKLIRPNTVKMSEPYQLSLTLEPQTQSEIELKLTAASVVMPQRLRGSINFLQSSTNHRLDFKLYLPCSSYLVATKCSSERYTKLLASEELTEKSSIRIMSLQMSFDEVLSVISQLHFTVVEQIAETASLFSISIQHHHLCLLIKKMVNGVSVEGKGDNQSILSNVIDEIKLLIQG